MIGVVLGVCVTIVGTRLTATRRAARSSNGEESLAATGGDSSEHTQVADDDAWSAREELSSVLVRR
jgi:hypothetical protein